MSIQKTLKEIIQRNVETAVAEVQAAYAEIFAAEGAIAAAPSRKPATKKPAKAAKAAKPAKKVKSAPGTKRDPAEIEKIQSAIVEFVTANTGCSMEQLGKGIGYATKDLVLPMRKLVESKKIGSKGQKRATRYFPRGS